MARQLHFLGLAIALFAASLPWLHWQKLMILFYPTGNITIKWDIMQWTSDGYVAVVSVYNYQKY